jgi:ornithine--oxo-acid transaminase
MIEGILCKETHENVIRIAPPLVITKEEIDWALERLRRVLTTPALVGQTKEGAMA